MVKVEHKVKILDVQQACAFVSGAISHMPAGGEGLCPAVGLQYLSSPGGMCTMAPLPLHMEVEKARGSGNVYSTLRWAREERAIRYLVITPAGEAGLGPALDQGGGAHHQGGRPWGRATPATTQEA